MTDSDDHPLTNTAMILTPVSIVLSIVVLSIVISVFRKIRKRAISLNIYNDSSASLLIERFIFFLYVTLILIPITTILERGTSYFSLAAKKGETDDETYDNQLHLFYVLTIPFSGINECAVQLMLIILLFLTALMSNSYTTLLNYGKGESKSRNSAKIAKNACFCVTLVSALVLLVNFVLEIVCIIEYNDSFPREAYNTIVVFMPAILDFALAFGFFCLLIDCAIKQIKMSRIMKEMGEKPTNRMTVLILIGTLNLIVFLINAIVLITGGTIDDPDSGSDSDDGIPPFVFVFSEDVLLLLVVLLNCFTFQKKTSQKKLSRKTPQMKKNLIKSHGEIV
ncbi:hypothetical protein ADUPG1_009827 [Aduncisulcus paluster]|uniref:Serpentine receptor class gamma n=1 Tax=Aduncisulcus paluster TaxID=2918883 RepID=A0ABQ5KWX8_9EUKA|nr:hypothetical protein ADUPG1_009827 [Aduncisulcus paluster]